MNEFDENSIKLLRHILGSIDLSDVKEVPELSEAERLEHNSAISSVWSRLEKDIKRLVYEQAIDNAANVQTWEQTIFGKGTLNGFSLLLEYWGRANAAHMENMKPKEGIDPTEVIGKPEDE